MLSEELVKGQLAGHEKLLEYERQGDADPLWMAELRGSINALRFVLTGSTKPAAVPSEAQSGSDAASGEAERQTAWNAAEEAESRVRQLAPRMAELEAELAASQTAHATCHELASGLQLRLNEAEAERDRLKRQLAEVTESAAMACIAPAPDCDCAGCSYAKEKHSV